MNIIKKTKKEEEEEKKRSSRNQCIRFSGRDDR